MPRNRRRLEVELADRHARRLELQQERLRLEHERRLHDRMATLEAEIRSEVEATYLDKERLEVEQFERLHDERLEETASQPRVGIRARLEADIAERLARREVSLRAEYDRRAHLEEEMARSIQVELEEKLRIETEQLESRMREDVDLALTRKREELKKAGPTITGRGIRRSTCRTQIEIEGEVRSLLPTIRG